MFPKCYGLLELIQLVIGDQLLANGCLKSNLYLLKDIMLDALRFAKIGTISSPVTYSQQWAGWEFRNVLWTLNDPK